VVTYQNDGRNPAGGITLADHCGIAVGIQPHALVTTTGSGRLGLWSVWFEMPVSRWNGKVDRFWVRRLSQARLSARSANSEANAPNMK